MCDVIGGYRIIVMLIKAQRKMNWMKKEHGLGDSVEGDCYENIIFKLTFCTIGTVIRAFQEIK